MAILRSAAVYFGIVFATGFVLGTVRVTLLLPRLGERTAELIEAPFMLGAMVLAARWLVRRRPAPTRDQLAAGLLAASVVIGADIVVGLTLRGLRLGDIFFDRDPVAGGVYYLMVALFAVLPGWLSYQRGEPSR